MDNFKVIRLRTGEIILATIEEQTFGGDSTLLVNWPVLGVPIRNLEGGIAHERLVMQQWMQYSVGTGCKLQKDMVTVIADMRPLVRYQYEAFIARQKEVIDAELMNDAIVKLMESVNPGYPPMEIADELVYDQQDPKELPTMDLTELLDNDL
jgi:hypothetical protein